MDQKTDHITRKYILTGRVQGVGFRWFTKRIAEKFAINGYVKNEYDGSVLVVAQGLIENIESFEGELSRGPSYAWVKQMSIEPPDNKDIYQRFEIR